MGLRGGAPLGNKNACRKPWQDALTRAIAQHKDKDVLRKIADRMLEAALTGDLAAIKELADRVDGKPKQQTEISGPDGGAVEINSLSKDQVDQQLTALIAAYHASKTEEE